MATNDTDADETGEQSDDYRVPVPPSDADLEPNDVVRQGALGNRFQTTVDIVLPREIVAAVAYRAGVRSAREGQVTPQDIHDIALDYASVWPRFLVRGDELPLAEWVEEQADIPVDHSEPVQHPDRHLFNATAEYRPEGEVPLHITLQPPQTVLDEVGGWAALTESARIHHGGERDDT